MDFTKTTMITMADIAKKAGVSRSTTSFVLNDRQTGVRISDETRRRVLDAARDLGYQRNELARAVVTGRNFVLGYLKDDVSEQDARILDGVLKEASEAGYLTKVLSPGDHPSAADITRRCVEQRLAGLIIRRFEPREIKELCTSLAAYGIPLVLVDDNLVMPDSSYVTSDDAQGCRLAVEHLIELGHKRIAYIDGDPIYPQTQLRQETYRRVMSEHDLPVSDASILDSGWNWERIAQLTRQTFQGDPPYPTAIFCDGDALAAIAIRTLRRMGLRVPEDVSVVGYGGFSFAALLDPPITTVAQPFEGIGRAAVRHLLHYIREKEEHSDASGHNPAELLATQLILGESTAPPAD